MYGALRVTLRSDGGLNAPASRGSHSAGTGSRTGRPRVAVRPEAVELVAPQLLDAGGAARGPLRFGRHAGVVELAVREERAAVAVDAACLADEEPQARRPPARRQSARRHRRRSGRSAPARADAALVGRDRLADVGERAVHRAGRPHPARRARRSPSGDARRQPRARERPNTARTAAVARAGDDLDPREAVLYRALERPERLRPEAVLAPVPEEPRLPARRRRCDIVRRVVVPMPRPSAASVLEAALRRVAARARDARRSRSGALSKKSARPSRAAPRGPGEAVRRIGRRPRARRARATAARASSLAAPRARSAGAAERDGREDEQRRAGDERALTARERRTRRARRRGRARRAIVNWTYQKPAHLELHPLDLVAAVAELRDTRLRRQAVPVLRHVAVDAIDAPVDRVAVARRAARASTRAAR